MKLFSMRKWEGVIFLLLVAGIIGPIASIMGLKNMLSTIMATAHDLLLNTVFYIMSITVITGALGALLIEFGVVRIFEKILTPFMKPLYNLPGVASLGGLLTFLSDNPAIISLANEKHYRKYFKPWQLVSLTNYGTAYGMGLIVITFMMGKGFFTESLIGLFGAVVGSIVSVRLMQKMVRPLMKEDEDGNDKQQDIEKVSLTSSGTVSMRFLNSILDGGKKGVDLGLSIIPGVLIISTFIMLITFEAHDPAIGYTGAAYEGVPFLPLIGKWLQVPFYYLFGFSSPEAISFPITSLGAVGAALSLVPKFIDKGVITGNEIAVFTAMGMCWSGFLSTHTAMLDSLNYRSLISKAIKAHTVGGIVAGIAAHYGYLLFKLL